MSSGVGLHNYEAEIVNKLSGIAIKTTPSTRVGIGEKRYSLA